MDLSPKSDLHFYNCENEDYRKYLKAYLKAVDSLLTNKQKRALINNKLQFRRPVFDVDQYIQSACELSVIARMYVDYPVGFEYEPKKNKDNEQHKHKDVDFSFTYDFLKVNVEIKCFNRGSQHKEIMPSENESNDLSIIKKSRFLALKDFFLKANEKFGNQEEFEVNVLFVCCYDLDDYIDVANSLAGKSGVCFRKNNPESLKNCILDVENFKKIDVVIVSNIAFHHENFNRSNQGNFLNPWDFCNAFTMGFQVHNIPQVGIQQVMSQFIKQAFNIQNDRYIEFCNNKNLDRLNFDVSLRMLIDYMNNDLDGYYFIADS